MFTSSVKSPAPKATRLTRVPAARIASIWLRPRAVSMIGTRSIARGTSPCSRSSWARSQSAVASRAGLSTFGEPRADDRRQIAVTELGVDRIDADIQPWSPRAHQGRDHRIPRRPLLGGRDRILEIEDHRIGVEGQRLLDPPRVVPRRKQKTPQRPHGCFPWAMALSL